VHVRSSVLGLVGIIDLVEVHSEGDRRRFVPVETKRGMRKKWLRDDVQLCAQAIALEEMTGTMISEGAIFHAASKKRRVVRFSSELRLSTANAAARLHAILAAREVPLPVADERCPACSLRDPCQPGALLPAGSLAVHLRRALE
jgi:CRISPR-associated exonuclease Cas4